MEPTDLISQIFMIDLKNRSEDMAGTKGFETIVEGDEEIGGKKRVSSDSDSDSDCCPAKKAKVEGEAGGSGTKDEEELNNKVERLRGLLVDDPKKMSKKDVDEAIDSLKVDEIIGLALKSDQGEESDDGRAIWWEDEACCVKELSTVRLMLVMDGLVEAANFRLVYEKWPAKAVAAVVVAAMDSFAYRCSAYRNSGDPLKMVKYRDIIPKLCRVLPFKLFAHVTDKKRVLWFASGIDEEETRRLQKAAAGNCDFCLGTAEHTGGKGQFCTLMDAVPKGTTIPPGYRVDCRLCGEYVCGSSKMADSYDGCGICEYGLARASPIPPFAAPSFPF